MTKDTMVDLIRDLPVDSTSKREASTRGKVVGWVLIRGKTVGLIKGQVEETALIRDRMCTVLLTKGHPMP